MFVKTMREGKSKEAQIQISMRFDPDIQAYIKKNMSMANMRKQEIQIPIRSRSSHRYRDQLSLDSSARAKFRISSSDSIQRLTAQSSKNFPTARTNNPSSDYLTNAETTVSSKPVYKSTFKRVGGASFKKGNTTARA